MIQTVLPYLAASLLVLVVVWSFLLHRVTTLLRHNHPRTFEKLGKPTPFRNRGPTSFRFLGFLVSREYRELGDSSLSSVADQARVFFVAYMSVFAIVVGIFVIGLLSSH